MATSRSVEEEIKERRPDCSAVLFFVADLFFRPNLAGLLSGLCSPPPHEPNAIDLTSRRYQMAADRKKEIPAAQNIQAKFVNFYSDSDFVANMKVDP